MQHTQSHQWFERAQKSLPGGVNSPVRAFKSVGMNPLFIERGEGSKIYDVDGNEYLDYVGSWGPLILGHAHEGVQQALKEALETGTSFGAPTPKEVILAEMLKEAVPSMEMLRLVNSGTEASMGAIRAARGYTGKSKVIKFEGCYHGSIDYLLVKAGSGATTLGSPDSAGVPAAFTESTLLAKYNDLASVQELVEWNSNEIAAIILEPITGNMGMMMPEYGFLQELRQICDRENILLIFDEVMTGFRVDFGGAQSLLNVQPDLSVFGKVIGGGLPVGAYGGRQDIMECVAPVGPVYQAGTLSGNPLAVSAGIATLQELQKEGVYSELAQKSIRLTQALKDACDQANIPVQVNHAGGMFGFFFTESPIRNYQDALNNQQERFQAFFQAMLHHGVYLPPSSFEACFVSLAHTDEDIEKTVSAIQQSIQTL